LRAVFRGLTWRVPYATQRTRKPGAKRQQKKGILRGSTTKIDNAIGALQPRRSSRSFRARSRTRADARHAALCAQT
jgi:hypothetical protein